MSQKLRMAILECDTPVDVVKEYCGTYGDRFGALLKNALPQCLHGSTQLSIETEKFDVVGGEYPALQAVNGILLTGSMTEFDAFADVSWISRLVEFVKSAFEARIPIVGVCFGHQILARAMGGTIARSPDGWEVSVETINLTEAGSALFGKKTLSLHQMHRDVVLDVPQGFKNLGHSPRCGIQGLWKHKRALSVQAHPEFDSIIMQNLLNKRHTDGVFDDAMYEDGCRRAELAHDGLSIMVSFLQFFIESSKDAAGNNSTPWIILDK